MERRVEIIYSLKGRVEIPVEDGVSIGDDFVREKLLELDDRDLIIKLDGHQSGQLEAESIKNITYNILYPEDKDA